MKKIVAVLLSISAFSANAITNIESQRLKPLKEGLSGNIELKLDGKSGNTDEEDYGFSGRLNHKKNADLMFVIATKEYGTSNDVKDTDKNFVHTRWVRKQRDNLASEVFAQYQDNEFTRLISRYLVGAGMRYTLINQPNQLNLAIGGGAFYVQEREDLVTIETDEDYMRINTYASYKHQLNENVSIISTAYFQPRASDFDDYNVLLNTSLFAKLSEQLKLKLSLNVTHDSEPPENLTSDPIIEIDSTDTEYSVSFVYEF